MEETSIQKVVTTQLQSMIQHFFPIKLREDEQQKYLAYFLRVLSGRIYASAVEDEQHLSTLIKRRISKLHAKSSETSKLARFQVLLDKLSASKVISKKWAILYCLYSLSEDSTGASIIPTIIQESMGGKMLMKIQPKQHEAMIIDTKPDTEHPAKTLAKEIRGGPVPSTKINLFGNVSEEDILRDLLYVFQEIDGKYISYSLLDDTFTISSSVIIAEPARGLVLELCELGWLYKRVVDYVNKHTDNAYAGQVVQSFCFAIQGELNEYFRLLAVLEQQLHDNQKSAPENRLDLMKLYLWMQEPMERMKWLAVICDTTQNLKGGALASTIQQHTYGGTATLYKFLSRVLQEVCAPLLNMIKQWMIHGEAHDLYGDFFVVVDPNVTEERLWWNKYSLNVEQIPTFLTYDLAYKVFLTGKAINFIRKCCSEAEWTVASSLQEPDIKNWTEIMENPGAIGEWILKIYEATNAQLISLLFTKYRFLDHCESIRRYLLLAQGDMHQYLMDLIYDTLSKPAEQIYKHNLVAILETAIRGSNAQYHKTEHLQCLDVKLLEASTGDDGWKIFSLEYKVGPPLSTILTPMVMNDYLRIFNYLWRLKRIEYVLSTTWSQQMGNKKALSALSEIQGDLQKANTLRHEMLLFISNLANYIMVEVVESNWKNFLDEVRKAKSLDDVIRIHKKMVDTILEKILLTQKNENLYKQLFELFELILRFKHSQDVLYTSAIEEYHRRIFSHSKAKMERLGLEGSEEKSISHASSKVSFEACINLQNLYKEYKDRYKQFFESLVQKNDEELKMLTFRLDFNEYYTDKFYQASEFDFKSQEDYKASNISLGPTDQPIVVIEDSVKPVINEDVKDFAKEMRRIEPKTEERKLLARKVGSSATKLVRPPREDLEPPKKSSIYPMDPRSFHKGK